KIVDEQCAAFPAPLRKKIVTGLGVVAAECTLDSRQTLDQIRVAQEAGFGGYALFSLTPALRYEILPCLNFK
ncbi:MAG: hypothetical protein FWF84_03765, partial [Kiritimatiellaeota bacterium]|nr:hypothetical protein [Kiritimatiellota bacterium]